jgi:hypothetical protein
VFVLFIALFFKTRTRPRVNNDAAQVGGAQVIHEADLDAYLREMVRT